MKLKFLQQGDYVKNLTKEQFDELIDIENNEFIKIPYKESVKKLGFDGKGLYSKLFVQKTELNFSEFKQRAINTFQNAK